MKPAQGERLSAVAVGEQSEVADLDEAGTCGLSGLEMPNCLRNCAQAMRTPLATMG
jgi:hypothetical protein